MWWNYVKHDINFFCGNFWRRQHALAVCAKLWSSTIESSIKCSYKSMFVSYSLMADTFCENVNIVFFIDASLFGFWNSFVAKNPVETLMPKPWLVLLTISRKNKTVLTCFAKKLFSPRQSGCVDQNNVWRQKYIKWRFRSEVVVQRGTTQNVIMAYTR